MGGHAVRWRRYGKDRLYVTATDGTALGYRDLATGEDHCAEPTRTAEFTATLDDWLRDQSSTPTPTGIPSGTRDTTSWEDLAQRTAGAMARERAVELRDAAPVKTFLARVLRVHTDERAWRIGADGEEKVAPQLDKLARKDPRWRFLHAIPVGQNGADIDHLVIGPGGVFSLNAKHHPGARVWVGGNTVMVDGQRQPYIRNSQHEATRASRLLTAACGFPVSVTGLVVAVRADAITIKTPPADVHVVHRMGLVRWLRYQPDVLTDTQVDAVVGAARRPTTLAADPLSPLVTARDAGHRGMRADLTPWREHPAQPSRRSPDLSAQQPKPTLVTIGDGGRWRVPGWNRCPGLR
jgi:hypothetical protein